MRPGHLRLCPRCARHVPRVQSSSNTFERQRASLRVDGPQATQRPQWSIRFFRPLSSWSLALDHWLFGRSAAAAHAQSLAWLLMLIAAVPSIIAGTLPPAGERILAALGALITLGVASLTWRCRAELGPELSRRLGWLGLASLASLIPMAGGFIGGRMLPLASVGSAAVIGSTLDALWRLARARVGASLALPHEPGPMGF